MTLKNLIQIYYGGDGGGGGEVIIQPCDDPNDYDPNVTDNENHYSPDDQIETAPMGVERFYAIDNFFKDSLIDLVGVQFTNKGNKQDQHKIRGTQDRVRRENLIQKIKIKLPVKKSQ